MDRTASALEEYVYGKEQRDALCSEHLVHELISVCPFSGECGDCEETGNQKVESGRNAGFTPTGIIFFISRGLYTRVFRCLIPIISGSDGSYVEVPNRDSDCSENTYRQGEGGYVGISPECGMVPMSIHYDEYPKKCLPQSSLGNIPGVWHKVLQVEVKLNRKDMKKPVTPETN